MRFDNLGGMNTKPKKTAYAKDGKIYAIKIEKLLQDYPDKGSDGARVVNGVMAF